MDHRSCVFSAILNHLDVAILDSFKVGTQDLLSLVARIHEWRERSLAQRILFLVLSQTLAVSVAEMGVVRPRYHV